MKILSVFSLVIIFHIAVLGLLLIQPGCQTQQAKQPDPAATRTEPELAPLETAELDPAFNAGIQASAPVSNRTLSAPTRPETSFRDQPSTGQLESVLQPVQDTYTLPSEQREVVVQAGDTLSGIAKREGVSLQDLLLSNNLSRKSTIYVGQTLFVPVSDGSSEVIEAEIEHSGVTTTVKRGDTLSAIASRHGTTVRDLKLVNGLRGDTIFVGQTLLLPDSANPPPAPSNRSQSRASFASGLNSYTVAAGDTPSGIARKFGISSRELMTANNITDPRKLVIGMNLVIPGQGSAATRSRPTRTQSTQSPPPLEPVTAPVEQETTSVIDPELEAMSSLEALEDEELPYVEVEAVEDTENPPMN